MLSIHAKTGRLGIRWGVLISLLACALLSALYLTDVFSVLDLKMLDLHFRLRGERTASDKIALVQVDDATIRAYRWPLPREAYALLLTAIAEAGAGAIGVDLVFIGNNAQSPQSDKLLASVTASYPRIVHAVIFFGESPGSAREEGPPVSALEVLRRQGIEGSMAVAAPASSVSLPFTELLEASAALGHVTVAVDRDGGIRRLPLFVRYDGRLYPALGLRVVGVAEEHDSLPDVRPASGGVSVLWPDGKRLFVPLDEEGATAIDFAGDRDAFPRSYSMLEVLRWYREGKTSQLADALSGRIVLLGNTAVQEAATELGATPFATATPLVYVHANAIDAVLRGRFLRDAPRLPLLLAMGGVSFLLGWLFVTLPLPIAAGAMAGSLAILAAAEYGLFALYRVHVPSTFLLLLPPLSYAAIASYRLVFLEKKTREREKELAVARAIQQRLLPASPPQVPGLDVFGVNVPAKEVGGDYFDWVDVGEAGLAVVVGDVSGKGVAAALLMSHLHASVHAVARGNVTPRAIVSAVSASLFEATESDRFATFFLARISRDKQTLTYCSAGHNPALLIHGGSTEFLGPTGVPLGLFEGTECGEETRSFRPGDLLVLYSDGITECHRHGKFYGEDRLSRMVSSLAPGSLSAEEIGRSILADVRSFSRDSEYADDLTLVVIRRT